MAFGNKLLIKSAFCYNRRKRRRRTQRGKKQTANTIVTIWKIYLVYSLVNKCSGNLARKFRKADKLCIISRESQTQRRQCARIEKVYFAVSNSSSIRIHFILESVF